jgi:hypothetical protein
MRIGRTQAIIRLVLAGLLLLFIYYQLFTGGKGP